LVEGTNDYPPFNVLYWDGDTTGREYVEIDLTSYDMGMIKQYHIFDSDNITPDVKIITIQDGIMTRHAHTTIEQCSLSQGQKSLTEYRPIAFEDNLYLFSMEVTIVFADNVTVPLEGVLGANITYPKKGIYFGRAEVIDMYTSAFYCTVNLGFPNYSRMPTESITLAPSKKRISLDTSNRTYHGLWDEVIVEPIPDIYPDVSNDTVTPETLAEGVTAHDASGAAIVGTMIAGEDLSAELEAQAEIIAQLEEAVAGKAGGSETSQVNVSVLLPDGNEATDIVISMYDADHDRLCVVFSATLQVISIENATLINSLNNGGIINTYSSDKCLFLKDILGDVTISVNPEYSGQ